MNIPLESEEDFIYSLETSKNTDNNGKVKKTIKNINNLFVIIPSKNKNIYQQNILKNQSFNELLKNSNVLNKLEYNSIKANYNEFKYLIFTINNLLKKFKLIIDFIKINKIEFNNIDKSNENKIENLPEIDNAFKELNRPFKELGSETEELIGKGKDALYSDYFQKENIIDISSNYNEQKNKLQLLDRLENFFSKKKIISKYNLI